MSATPIEWTKPPGFEGETWNPTLGCSKVSPGCKRCYAIRSVRRMSGNPNAKIAAANAGLVVMTGAGLNWTGKVNCLPERLTIPLEKRKPTCWFVNSLSDLFHEEIPDEFIDQVFAVMALCPQHQFKILTKRAERMRVYFRNSVELRQRLSATLLDQRFLSDGVWGDVRRMVLGNPSRAGVAEGLRNGWRTPLPDHIHLGVSVENQATADERIPHLLQTPAAIRFVSYEPALEGVHFKLMRGYCTRCNEEFISDNPTGSWSASSPARDDHRRSVWCRKCGFIYDIISGVNQIIVGGESGPDSRPFDIEWARRTIRQCAAADVACFIKQLGAKPFDGNPLKLKDKKGGTPEEWALDLRVRQFPEVRNV